MDPIETYATLYDEVTNREHGKDLHDPAYGTVWTGVSEAEQRVVEAHDPGLAATIEAYVASVEAFDTAHRALTLPHRDEDGVDWASGLWDFVTDEDLDLKGVAEARNRHNREISAYAQTLVEEIGRRLDAHAEPSFLERVKRRLS